MHLKLIVEKNFNIIPAQPQQKMRLYKCKFCSQTYAHHISRMARHLLQKCRGCPQMIKDKLKRKCKPKRDQKRKNHKCRSRNSSWSGSEVHFESDSSNTTGKENDNESNSNYSSITAGKENDKENHLLAGSSSGSNSLANKNNKSQLIAASKIKSFCDTMTKSDVAKSQKILAKAIISSGTPLSMTENEHWQQFFACLRPAFPLPSRKLISNKFLDDLFEEVKRDVDKKVAAASCVGIQCDGWSNIRNEGIINFILKIPEPVFYKSVSTKANSETSEYIANEMSKVIEDVGPAKILAVCTDNAAAMKAAWRKLDEQYEMYNLVFYGCAAHTLNLLVQDLTKQPTIDQVANSVKSAAREVKESHILSAKFAEIPSKDSHNIKTTLKLPVITRWGSIVTSLHSIKINKHNLQALAIDQSVSKKLQRLTKALLLDEEFWIRVEKTLELLEPVTSWITSLEGDTPKLSSVPEAFAVLEQHFMDKLEESCPSLFPVIESRAVFAALEKRQKMAVTPAHLAANILDPALKGRRLTEEEQATGTVLIHKLAVKFELDVDKVLSELADYIANEGLWQHQYVQQASFSTTAAKWWKGIWNKTCLSKIAQEILNLPATSAATERSFSTHGWIHNAKRNRLTASRAAKMTYISYNMRLCQDQRQKKASPPSETNEESELELASEIELNTEEVEDVEYLDVEFLDPSIQN